MADMITSWMQFILGDKEYRVLLFIYNRTYLWGKAEDWIAEKQFLQGIKGYISPLQMSRTVLYRALNTLQEKGILHKRQEGGKRGPTFYSINHDWQIADHVSPEILNSVVGDTYMYRGRDTTVRELTLRDNTGCARERAQGLEGNENMGAIDNVKSAVAAATNKQKLARDKRKAKLNATALQKIWEDAFRATYPDEKMFAWRSYELPAFRKAMDRGVPTDDIQNFVTFCVAEYDNVIANHFSWMASVSKTPSVSFVIKHVDKFFEAFEIDRDPNRKLRLRLNREAAKAPVAVEKPDPDTAQQLAEENRLLKNKLAAMSAKDSTERRERVKGYLKRGKKLTTGPAAEPGSPFRPWK